MAFATLSKTVRVTLQRRLRRTVDLPDLTAGTLTIRTFSRGGFFGAISRRIEPDAMAGLRPRRGLPRPGRPEPGRPGRPPVGQPSKVKLQLKRGDRVVATSTNGRLVYNVPSASTAYKLVVTNEGVRTESLSITISYPSTRQILTKSIPMAFLKLKFDEFVNDGKNPLFKLRLHGEGKKKDDNKVFITYDPAFADLHGLAEEDSVDIGHVEASIWPFKPDVHLKDINSTRTNLTVSSVRKSFRSRERVPQLSLKMDFETGGRRELSVNNFSDVDITKLSLDITVKLIASRGKFDVIPSVDVDVKSSINNLPDWVKNTNKLIRERFRDKIVAKFDRKIRNKLHQSMARWLLGGETTVRKVTSNGRDIVIEYLEQDPANTIQPFPERPQRPTTPGNLSKIDHIVVLMMENRSFDHMLGYLSLHEGRTDVDGLTGNERNIYKRRTYRPFPLPEIPFDEDPCHEFECVADQVSGNMGGFVREFAARYEAKGINPGKVMGYYRGHQVNVYDALAKEYGICDRWFCTHPGPTWANRFQTFTGRLNRDGFGRFELNNPDLATFSTINAKTIFDHLEDRNIDWACFEHDFSFLRLYSRWSGNNQKIRPFNHATRGFFAAARSGRLPAVTWIDPNYTDVFPGGNDDHPDSDVRNGQRLIGQITNALMNGPKWDKTMFIITYDEHGGFYDHVVPPRVPEVCGIDRLGPRVPAFVISPWVERPKVSHTVFDHTSILKTIVRRFMAANPPDLGDRANRANDLGEFLSLDQARTDRPTIPEPAAVNDRSRVAPVANMLGRDFHDLVTIMKQQVRKGRRAA